MPQSLFKFLAHIVFSTKNREALILPDIENDLFGYIHGIVRNNNSRLITAGGTKDHVHLLISLPKTIAVPNLIGDIKRDSSNWIKKQDSKFADFYWQKGYGAFSVGQSQIKTVIEYVGNQKDHHNTRDFKDEYRAMLRKYEIDFDERYVWD